MKLKRKRLGESTEWREATVKESPPIYVSPVKSESSPISEKASGILP